MAAPTMNIYVNGTYVTTTNRNVDVVSSGLSVSGSMIWTYSGDGTFQGVEVTGKVWSPGTYLVGTSFSADSSGGRVDCAVIAQTTSKEYKYYPKADLTAIADAIRSVKGTSTAYTIDQMIETLAGGGKVTDLSGTTWVFNEVLNLSDYGSDSNYTLTLTIDSTDAIDLFVTSQNLSTSIKVGRRYMFTAIYDQAQTPAWTREAYRTITITGGTDVTNTDLIDWLYANATLQS